MNLRESGFALLEVLITIVIGFLCWAAASGEWKRRAWNTIWTARTTLTLSTALFANLTLAIWAALFKGVQTILPCSIQSGDP